MTAAPCTCNTNLHYELSVHHSDKHETTVRERKKKLVGRHYTYFLKHNCPYGKLGLDKITTSCLGP